MKTNLFLLSFLFVLACGETKKEESQIQRTDAPFMWENATVYFMLTDRFNNGDTTNDLTMGRKADGAVLRSFMGGDIKGITQKINDGYFDELGVTALWMNPMVENIKGAVDEGTGKSYGFHGYWTRDWTVLDPNFGTIEDYKEMIDAAHARGIRVLMDVVANHTGPVTEIDSKWPDDWVRENPTCTYQDWETTVKCTLVDNLPDIFTESDEDVELPEFLLEKWEQEGRLEQELSELDAFFDRTGFPRAPRFYIFKWLTDYVRELGIDGYRVDTAKHTEAGIWAELYAEAQAAFQDWKEKNPNAKLDDEDFYMVGEVYNYAIQHGQEYTYDGDTAVNFYENGFKALINFSLKWEIAQQPMDEVFAEYSNVLNSELSGYSVMNYMSSHDDGNPFDAMREKPYETANALMLSPGAAQIYYGDETARILRAEGAEGDAHLRTFMNWEDLETNADRGEYKIGDLRDHWARLGQFRKNHPAIGAGIHEKISDEPYAFKRSLSWEGGEDVVVVVMDENITTTDVSGIFEDGTSLINEYTGEQATVSNGAVSFEKSSKLLLISRD